MTAKQSLTWDLHIHSQQGPRARLIKINSILPPYALNSPWQTVAGIAWIANNIAENNTSWNITKFVLIYLTHRSENVLTVASSSNFSPCFKHFWTSARAHLPILKYLLLFGLVWIKEYGRIVEKLVTGYQFPIKNLKPTPQSVKSPGQNASIVSDPIVPLFRMAAHRWQPKMLATKNRIIHLIQNLGPNKTLWNPGSLTKQNIMELCWMSPQSVQGNFLVNVTCFLCFKVPCCVALGSRHE